VNDDKNLKFKDLLQIVELIKSSAQFGEFHLKTGDFELDIKRGGASAVSDAVAPAAQAQANPADNAVPGARAPEAIPGAAIQISSAGDKTIPMPGAALPHAPAHSGLPDDVAEDAVIVTSPMVGTCYRASEPDAAPFVEVGTAVAPDTVLCIIEVMKLMNSIRAERAGIVTHILANDGDPVEFGQPIFVISPEAKRP
jgi:acetyl-CoA carboxylase biotin carboxyl carrier protein